MNEKRILEASKDSFVLKTSDPNEALEFLYDRKECTKVIVIDSLSIIPVAAVDTRIDPEQYRKYNITNNTMPDNIGYSQEQAFEENARNVGLIVTTTKGYNCLLLRATALDGVFDQTGTSGSGWNRAFVKSKILVSDAANALIQCNPGRYTLIEVFGRTTGIASSKYQYLPQEGLFQAFITAGARSNGKLGEFIYTHSITYAYIDFPAEEAKKYGVDVLNFDQNKTTLRMYMVTSDCRQSSAHVWFELTDGDKCCTAIGAYQAHKGKSAIAKFSESCFTMFEALTQSVTMLTNLKGIQLQYPESTIREVAHRMGVADKHISSVILEAKSQGITMQGWSAYEGYLFLCGAIDTYQPNRKGKKVQFFGNSELFAQYEKTEQKAKVIRQPWKDIDTEERYEPLVLQPKTGKTDVLPGQLSLDDMATAEAV